MARIPPSWPLEELDRVLPLLVDQGLPGGGEFLLAELKADEKTPAVIAILIWHGYLPMAGDLMGSRMLLPKIHHRRCVLAPADVHVGRKVRRKAKGFHLTIGTAWSQVVTAIQQFTFTMVKGDCWLSDELARAYEAVTGVNSKWRRGGVRFHSIELWHTESGKLVAGEIGYTCGSIYSSCTGFALKEEYSGAGSVQLAALGRWLAKSGFAIWDLGMELDYKLELGGQLVPRKEWIRTVRSLREPAVELRTPSGDDTCAHRLLSALEPKLEPALAVQA